MPSFSRKVPILLVLFKFYKNVRQSGGMEIMGISAVSRDDVDVFGKQQ